MESLFGHGRERGRRRDARSYSPFQILAAYTRVPSNPDGKYSPEEAADLAYGWAASSCPEESRNNEALRVYLQNWTIDPDE